MSKFIDMTGWIMSEHGVPDSKLTVVGRAEDYIRKDNGGKIVRWWCRCNCGNQELVLAFGQDLRRGHTLSCGCTREERIYASIKKYNRYDLSGEYGVGWTTNTDREFYFDLEDFDKIKDYCWVTGVSGTGYTSLVTYDNESKKMIKMAWLFGCKSYDHIDRNPLNNRKNNLRPATRSENSRNSSLSRRNTSGVIGVSWIKDRQKWLSQIGFDNTNHRIGSFTAKEDAIKARLEAELKYFGPEFAPQRHLFEQYGITIQNDLNEIEPIENLTTEETNDDCI